MRMMRISTGFSGRLWGSWAERTARTARSAARSAHLRAALGTAFGTEGMRSARGFTSNAHIASLTPSFHHFCVGLCGIPLGVVVSAAILQRRSLLPVTSRRPPGHDSAATPRPSLAGHCPDATAHTLSDRDCPDTTRLFNACCHRPGGYLRAWGKDQPTKRRWRACRIQG